MRIIGLDIETSDGNGRGSLEPGNPKSHIALIQLAHEDGEIELLRPTPDNLNRIRDYIDEGVRFIIHNAHFELEWFRKKHDLIFRDVWCTMVASQILNAGKTLPDKASRMATRKDSKRMDHVGIWEALVEEDDEFLEEKSVNRFSHNLVATAYRYANGAIMEKDQADSDWAREPLTEDQERYARDDVRYLHEIYQTQQIYIKKFNLERVAELEMRAIFPTTNMTHTGIKINREEWLAESNEHGKIADGMEEKLNYEMGIELAKREGSLSLFGDYVAKAFKVSSPSQVASFFGTENADESLLRTLDHPLIPEILEYKKHKKVATTYGENYLKHMHEDGRFHPRLQQTRTATGRFSSSSPNLQNCFDGETEILTEHGWFRFDSLPRDKKIAQFNTETNYVEFVEPLDYIEREHTGYMIQARNNLIDALVTPEHRILHKFPERRVWRDSEASEWASYWQIPVSADYFGGPLSRLVPDEIKFLIAVHMLGTVEEGAILFRFTNRSDNDHALIPTHNLRYSYDHGLLDGGDWYLIVDDEEALELVNTYLTDSLEFGPWLFELSRELLDTFVETIGSYGGPSRRQMTYTTKSGANSGLVQAAFTLSGWRAIEKQTEEGYTLHITRDIRYITSKFKQAEEVPYDGMVYCVTVPSGYIVVRRSGKTMITGNCPREMFSRTLDEDDGYVLLEADYSAVESRILAYAAEDQAYIDSVNSTDVHWANALKIFKLPEGSTRDEVYTIAGVETPGDDLRTIAKILSFSIPYGTSAFGLVNQGIAETEEEGQAFLDDFAESFPKVQLYLRKQVNDALTRGYCQDLFGRIRWFEIAPGLSEKELSRRRSAISREAMNMSIQALSASITKLALVRLNDKFNETGHGEIVLTIHDSIISRVKKAHVKEAALYIKQIMEECGPEVVPGIITPVDVDPAPRWAEDYPDGLFD